MRRPSHNRARDSAIRIKWISLVAFFLAAVFLIIDMTNGWALDLSIRLALVAAMVFCAVIHFAARLALAKWFSGSFTDDQDPMRF
jgi:hypothetical protein